MSMTTIFTNFEYATEVCDVAKLFFGDAVLIVEREDADITVVEEKTGSVYRYIAVYNGCKEECSFSPAGNELQTVRLRKRYAKIALYKVLSRVTGVAMPWGSLTGIRPTKLARQLSKETPDWKKTFTELLDVSHEKTSLVAEILQTQGSLRQNIIDGADLYIGIPFCVSRCSYCSFTSGELNRLRKYVEPYVDALCDDISQTIAFARERGIALNNVYFGGGTPTSLSAEQLDRIMSYIDFRPVEYTVEAGRPDTITEDKLEVFKRHGVDRVSINPQTFNQSVLDIIGRKHTVRDIYDKYALAKQYSFEVNMDLIAGLPTETYSMFVNSIDSAIELSPDNITVHTLALKRGSILKESNYAATEQDVSDMVRYAKKVLSNNGYAPYYMYRQKFMTENLENVGYCKKNTACLYNIGIMEEVANILACGTNAISKRIFSEEDRIERSANAKDVITYIERYKDYLDKKFELFSR